MERDVRSDKYYRDNLTPRTTSSTSLTATATTTQAPPAPGQTSLRNVRSYSSSHDERGVSHVPPSFMYRSSISSSQTPRSQTHATQGTPHGTNTNTNTNTITRSTTVGTTATMGSFVGGENTNTSIAPSATGSIAESVIGATSTVSGHTTNTISGSHSVSGESSNNGSSVSGRRGAFCVECKRWCHKFDFTKSQWRNRPRGFRRCKYCTGEVGSDSKVAPGLISSGNQSAHGSTHGSVHGSIHGSQSSRSGGHGHGYAASAHGYSSNNSEHKPKRQGSPKYRLVSPKK